MDVLFIAGVCVAIKYRTVLDNEGIGIKHWYVRSHVPKQHNWSLQTCNCCSANILRQPVAVGSFWLWLTHEPPVGKCITCFVRNTQTDMQNRKAVKRPDLKMYNRIGDVSYDGT